MTFEAWSLAASVGTLLVIAATAIAAMIQLRHMRGSNQITVISKLEETWNDPGFRAIRKEVSDGLAAHLDDPAFRAEIEKSNPNDEFSRAFVQYANFFEGMAIYAKHGLANPAVLFDFWGQIIITSWQDLSPAIAIMRRTGGPLLYENFQYLAVMAKRFIEQHPENTTPEQLETVEDAWLEADHPSAGR